MHPTYLFRLHAVLFPPSPLLLLRLSSLIGQSALREVYRPMEMVGLLSLAAHMACGAVRVWRRYDTVNRLVPLSARSTSDLHRLGG